MIKTYININEKTNKIYHSMSKFDELLVNAEKELDFNLNKLEQLNEFHINFINFIQIMNIYEKYKWTHLKYEYRNIKKKNNKDRKIIHIITKFFSSLTNYYTIDQIDNINIKINNINSKIELMIYNFIKIQILHNQISLKIKSIIRNNSILKIDNINDTNKIILLKLYENYISIKMLNIQLNNLKNVKKNLLHYIQSINQDTIFIINKYNNIE
jgi:hypothetical protein